MSICSRRSFGLIGFLNKFLAVSALIVASAVPSIGNDLSSFQGRTIEFIVGSNPGGGYDRTTRLVAEHMEKELPGSTIVVSNQARMGGMVALNRLGATTSDQPVLMMFNTGFLLSQLAESPLLRVDFTQLDYVGKVTSEARYLVASTASGLTSWEDVAAYDGSLLTPAQAPNSAGFVQARLFGQAFNLDIQPLTGFSGSEGRAALAKGELQMDLTSENNVERLIKAGAATPVLRFGPASVETFETVRDADTVVATDEQAVVVAAISGMTRLGRVIVASPGMSDEDLAVVRLAFVQAMGDPDFRVAAEEQDLAVDPRDGAETKALILQVLSSDGPIKGLVASVLE